MTTRRTFEYHGIEYTSSEIAKKFGIKQTTFLNRVDRYGFSVSRAIEVKAKSHVKGGDPRRSGSIYNAWRDIKARCCNPNHKSYHRYGGRGITVCDEWFNSFSKFADDMGEKPGKEFSVDRINNERGYYPGNCRWATKRQQANNTSININVTYDGKTQSATKWEREKGIGRGTLKNRLDRGMSVNVALNTPVKNKITTLTYNGETKTAKQWAGHNGVTYSMILRRKKKGWSDEDILSSPSRKKKLSYNGKEYSKNEFARKCGITRECLSQRLKKGWSLDKIRATAKWQKD